MDKPDNTSSPKKRKATGPQQPAPPPTSQPQYTSPQFSQVTSSVSNTPPSRRRGHSRQRSDMSSRGLDSYGRPTSRHRHTESSFSLPSLTSPRQISDQGPETMSQAGPRRRSGGSNPVSALLEESDSRPQSQQQSAVAHEMRHEERHTTSESENSGRPNAIKRDDGQD
ncbi:uncharacterized protein BP5553_01278 [Venustampulla echinocandica]|uniref:Uncharacterized protein n=1 Tax=Venustampulla echinocandica TaxID=2656787 RepID=A0A370U0K0_9HELO|nr:uncharacterized protein BP5553_01278 [Venustampulla echinocandica]RDL41299.1 hypothetical protein BP5553_01278 [Venustampulla echinocandica]